MSITVTVKFGTDKHGYLGQYRFTEDDMQGAIDRATKWIGRYNVASVNIEVVK